MLENKDVNDKVQNLSLEQLMKLRRTVADDNNLTAAEEKIRPRPPGTPAALSFAQERLWFVEKLGLVGSAYNAPLALRLAGSLDVEGLEKSLEQLVTRHESLRTRIESVDGQGVQVIDAPGQFVLEKIELRELTAAPEQATEETLERWVQQESTRAFEVTGGVLFRGMLLQVDVEDHVLLLCMHHIISDGWSAGILINELSELYRAHVQGRAAELPPLPIQYADYAVWQREWLQGEVLQRQLKYWRQQLAGLPAALDLPTDRPRPPVASFRGELLEFSLSRELTASLRRLSHAQGATLYMTLLAAFQLLLAKWTGESDIVVGSPLAGRQRRELEGVIGCFINTLIMRSDLSGNPSFEGLLRRVTEVALGAYAHQDIPFEKLVQELAPQRDLSRQPLFQVSFALQNLPRAVLALPGLQGRFLYAAQQISKFDLSLFLFEGEGRLSGCIEYATDLFDRGTIERLGRHFRVLLQGIVARPDVPIGQLPLLEASEREQLLVGWNQTQHEYPPEKCLHELFAEQAARTPGAVALVCAEEQLTYEELDRRSNQLANYLRGLGVGAEVIVGLCMERSVEMVVGLLGILKAGGAYLPLDPEYPAERLQYMLEDAKVSLVLSHRSFAGRVSGQRTRVICLDQDWPQLTCIPLETSAEPAQPGNLAYVIYTSGSTGKPKGAPNQHRGLVNRLCWMQAFGELRPGDRVLQKTPMSFDVSAWEFFWTLLNGATLVISRPGGHQDAAYLSELIRQQGVTVLHFVPSMLAAFTESNAGVGHDSVRMLVASGEALPVALVSPTRRCFPRAALVNLYGPTEAAIDVSCYLAEPEMTATGSIPIGRPIWNTQLYVLDEEQEPVPVGVAGELYIGGVGLARGYLNRAGLTAQRFVPSPFGEGERLYRTGDRVRYREDGNLEFLGRLDHQVKIRGYRIELGEIEAVLQRHGSVQQAVVLVREDVPGSRHLVGYVVGKGSEVPQAEVLQKYLQESLPQYMVPAVIVVLEQMPLTANGKIDRKGLPAPDQLHSAVEYVGARTPLEEALVKIWSEVLRVPRVGVHDNFFELGGDSIQSIRIAARAKQLGIELTVRQLFDRQTIAQLAAATGTGTPVVPAEQGLIEGEVPLTPIQRWFFETHAVEVNQLNQSLLLACREQMSAALLQAALGYLVAHHDALRMHFWNDGTDWRQRNAAAPSSLVVEIADLGPVAATGRAAAIRSHHEKLTNSLDIAGGVVLRVALFEMGAGEPQRLLIVIHHLVVDGVSWRPLLEDLFTVYRQLSSGESVCLPPKTNSFKSWAENLSAYAGSPALRAELAFWRELPWHSNAPLPGGRDALAQAAEIGKPVVISLSAAETEALLLSVPRAYDVHVDEVLVTAVARAVSNWTGNSSVLLDLEGHGREPVGAELDLTRTVGWFTSLYPLLLDLKGLNDIAEAIDEVKTRMRHIPDKGVGYGILRYLVRADSIRELPASRIRFNYLGQLDRDVTDSAHFKLAPEELAASSSPGAPRPYLIDINSIAVNGRLRIEWDYCPLTYDTGTVEQLARDFTECLREIIAQRPSDDAETYLLATADPAARYEPFPLTDIQEAYWVGRGADLELGNIAAYSYLEVEWEQLDVPRLEEAWGRIVQRHDMLRTIVQQDGKQRVLQTVPHYSIHTHDLRAYSQAEIDDALRASRTRLSSLALPPDRWPLFNIEVSRLPQDRARLHFGVDLLVCDAASVKTVFEELSAVYRSPDVELEPLEISFRDYVMAQEQLRQTASFRRSWRYWMNKVADLPDAPPLPVVADPAAITNPHFRSLSGRVSSSSWQAIQRHAARWHVTPTAILLAAYAGVLGQFSAERRFTLNVSVYDRLPLHPQVDLIVGDFTSVLPLVIELDPHRSFLAQAQAIQRQLWEDLDHRLVSGIRVMRERARRAGQYRAGLLPVVFTGMAGLAKVNRTLNERGNPAHEMHGVFASGQTPQVWLDLNVVDTEDGLAHAWLHVEELFPPGLVESLFTAFCEQLDRLARTEQAWQEPQSMALPLDQLSIRQRINSTSVAYPRVRLEDPFLEQVKARASYPAVICSHVSLTYDELARCSASVAERIGNSASRAPVVAVVMEKGWEQVAAVLGILRAGRSYVPIDPGLPVERIHHLLRHAEVEVAVTQPRIEATAIFPEGLQRILVDRCDLQHSAPAQGARGTADDLAYVIYTSGSTGMPKGVAITHAAAVNTILDINRRCRISAGDRVLSVSSLSFDLSVQDIFGTLAAGGAIVIPDAAERPDPYHWLELITRAGVTVWNSVPALMQLLVDEAERSGAAMDQLRLAMLSGDWTPVALPERIWRVARNCKVLVMGGATEASIWSIYKWVDSVDPRWVSIPYGRPLANQQFHVLSASFQDCPVWTVGELYIGGAGVAQGYWRDEELTRRSFVVHPRTRERLYKTGDMGRYLPDGEIEFLGRRDTQVKVAGHRIELGEIEFALSQCPRVRSSVVVVVPGEDGRPKGLAAYVVPSSNEVSGAEIREFLGTKLAAYMVPRHIAFITAVPLNANGKVDRKALPAVAALRESTTPDSAPRNQTEQLLVSLWSQVLGVDAIGIHDNFFDLGGHSLLGTQMLGLVRKDLQVSISLRTLFEQPTIAELAEVLLKEQARKTEAGSLAQDTAADRIRQRVEQLSDSEVRRLMETMR